MASFTVAAFGMIGVPPLAGFVSKWYLAVGALDAGGVWVLPVLVGSSVLNAAYFLPILYRAWFKEADRAFPAPDRPSGREIGWYLLLPPLFTAVCTVLFGVFAGAPYSPLAWAKLIAGREYGP
jgi:multicomponent Na+:H+ antiporter subunit D